MTTLVCKTVIFVAVKMQRQLTQVNDVAQHKKKSHGSIRIYFPKAAYIYLVDISTLVAITFVE